MTPHELATRYVKMLTERGYTAEDCDREACSGMCSPTEPGYDLRHGTITCPAIGDEKQIFNFRQIQKEIEAKQIQPELL